MKKFFAPCLILVLAIILGCGGNSNPVAGDNNGDNGNPSEVVLLSIDPNNMSSWTCDGVQYLYDKYGTSGNTPVALADVWNGGHPRVWGRSITDGDYRNCVYTLTQNFYLRSVTRIDFRDYSAARLQGSFSGSSEGRHHGCRLTMIMESNVPGVNSITLFLDYVPDSAPGASTVTFDINLESVLAFSEGTLHLNFVSGAECGDNFRDYSTQAQIDSLKIVATRR